ncbi:amidohydrolase family protein [Ruminococcaceae bacterium OttesenSCG-928-I18]|nr:amidohydrolase family protein [Ruminococcaceae bacterium OttesenSCG-928-I18]
MKAESTFGLWGDILYSGTPTQWKVHEESILLCEEGRVAGIFKQLPEKYKGVFVEDCRGALILPGLVDLHLHAPQYAFRGLSMDLELLDWLDRVTFPEEAKYEAEDYADTAYRQFVHGMTEGATTRACVFATVHTPATLHLMDLLEGKGLPFWVGKVNMDRNCPKTLCEASAEASLRDTRQWLKACEGHYRNVKPILTPRFIPACSDELLAGLGALQDETGLPVQSHLSENPGEVALVKKLCPQADGYADAYARFGLLGGEGRPTVMAHCVWPEPGEGERLAENGVYVAHCPGSNANLSSGIAPVRRYLKTRVRVGLGTDVAGGFSPSVFRAMADAVQHSKLRWRLVDDADAPLTLAEAFYMGTRGGGAFFGRVGAFEPGFAFDALVLEDKRLESPVALSLPKRLERAVYLSEERDIRQKYVQGKRVK